MEWEASFKKVIVFAKKTENDPEKTILPAIIYVNTNNKYYGNDRKKGVILAIRWWDFYIGFGLFFYNNWH